MPDTTLAFKKEIFGSDVMNVLDIIIYLLHFIFIQKDEGFGIICKKTTALLYDFFLYRQIASLTPIFTQQTGQLPPAKITMQTCR